MGTLHAIPSTNTSVNFYIVMFEFNKDSDSNMTVKYLFIPPLVGAGTSCGFIDSFAAKTILLDYSDLCKHFHPFSLFYCTVLSSAQ